jgi:hypothetical protein
MFFVFMQIPLLHFLRASLRILPQIARVCAEKTPNNEFFAQKLAK